MANGTWTGRWTVGCAGLFAGGMFLACFVPMVLAGERFDEAALTAAALGGICLLGAGLFAMLGARDEREFRRKLESVRSSLQERGAVSDEIACEPVSLAKRPFFFEVRRAAAEFLQVPPEWLRGTDSLRNDYRSPDLGWYSLEWHVFNRMQPGRPGVDPDRLETGPVPVTLADLAEHLWEIWEIEREDEPPPGTDSSKN